MQMLHVPFIALGVDESKVVQWDIGGLQIFEPFEEAPSQGKHVNDANHGLGIKGNAILGFEQHSRHMT